MEKRKPMAERVVSVNVSLYGLEAIYKSCYAFLDRAFFRLEGDRQAVVSVRMNPRPQTSSAQWETLPGEFENELIHQALRAKISGANQKIREFIVARALASAEGAAASVAPQAPAMDEALENEIEKLLAEVEKQADGDPLGIVAPWENKSASKSAR